MSGFRCSYVGYFGTPAVNNTLEVQGSNTYQSGQARLTGTVTAPAGGIVSGMTSGKVYFVDSANGSDANNGKTFASAFASIAAAIAVAVAGDTIFLKGSFSETATAGVAGLSIVGLGTGPKQAQWMFAADTATLTITANYVRVENVYFKPPADRPRRPTARRRPG